MPPSTESWKMSLVLDVLQLRLAEVVGRLLPPAGRSLRERGGLGEEDLAAMARRADPGGADDVEPEVAPRRRPWATGVQSHPHLHGQHPRATRGPPGRAGARPPREPHRVRCRTSRRMRRLACRPPSRRSSRTSRGRSPVISRLRLRTRLRAAGAAASSLDVGEDEGDGSGRQRRHGRDRNRARRAADVGCRGNRLAADEPVPPPARRESGRLVPAGPEALERARSEERPTCCRRL